MVLKYKASKINFGALGGTSPVPATEKEKSAKTAPGELMAFANQQRSQLLKDNEDLKVKAAEAESLKRSLDEAIEDLRQWDGAKAARLLDPSKIRRSRWANRHELNFESKDFGELCAEIRSAGGNIQPIKVRPVGDGGEGVEFEIVFGHRRHEACRREGLPVLALIDNIDERALFVEMDRENRARKDLSPYEQGQMYLRAIEGGLFPHNEALGAALGVHKTQVGKAIALARLPVEVVAAFQSPLDLQFRFRTGLDQALERNRAAVLKTAAGIAKLGGVRAAQDVYEQLIGAAGSTVLPAQPVAIKLKGKAVGQIKFQSDGSASMALQPGLLDEKKAQQLATFLAKLLAE